VRVDVRIVAATHRDVHRQIAESKFRADLYHRVAVVHALLPSLRERREDIPMLAAHFARNLVFAGGVGPAEAQAAAAAYTEAAFEVLARYDWPGNVRELRNVVERAAILYDLRTPRGAQLDLMQQLGGLKEAVSVTLSRKLPLRAAREQFEREYLLDLLRSSEGDVGRAATIAEVHPKSIERLLRKYRLRRS
jgi:DNA-binding NtrC family response regulator